MAGRDLVVIEERTVPGHRSVILGHEPAHAGRPPRTTVPKAAAHTRFGFAGEKKAGSSGLPPPGGCRIRRPVRRHAGRCGGNGRRDGNGRQDGNARQDGNSRQDGSEASSGCPGSQGRAGTPRRACPPGGRTGPRWDPIVSGGRQAGGDV
ncbi:hypothetical protein GCM10010415_18900 [Streptomyces atrovirens]